MVYVVYVRMCVCVYVCVYVCMCVCVYVCMCVQNIRHGGAHLQVRSMIPIVLCHVHAIARPVNETGHLWVRAWTFERGVHSLNIRVRGARAMRRYS